MDDIMSVPIIIIFFLNLLPLFWRGHTSHRDTMERKSNLRPNVSETLILITKVTTLASWTCLIYAYMETQVHVHYPLRCKPLIWIMQMWLRFSDQVCFLHSSHYPLRCKPLIWIMQMWSRFSDQVCFLHSSHSYISVVKFWRVQNKIIWGLLGAHISMALL